MRTRQNLPPYSLSIYKYIHVFIRSVSSKLLKLNLNQPRTCLLMTKQKRWSTSLSTSDESFLRSKIRILMNKISTALCFSFCIIMCKHGRDMRGAEQGTMPRQMGRDTCVGGRHAESLACGTGQNSFFFFRGMVFLRGYLFIY